MPTLILHGDDDQIVPIGASAILGPKRWRVDPEGVPGLSHGMCTINKDQINWVFLSLAVPC